VERVLDELWAPVAALTAADGARENGCIVSTALCGSLLPETPRVTVQLARASLTHELVAASRAFALHLLPVDSLPLFRSLGMRSGRDAPKLDGLARRPGVTGSPILLDAVAYVEARVTHELELEDVTLVVADVVAGEWLREEPYLTIEHVRSALPPEWAAEWERRREAEIAAARALR
jgi:flavin reductase (DIM6/NTAB) family NADH-FMN oxidoreductase RutF